MPGTIWTIDPDFRHFRPDGSFSHQEKWLRYKTFDGANVASQAHTHTNIYGYIRLTFEHFHEGDLDHSFSETKVLDFWDWEHARWRLSVRAFQLPAPKWFILQRLTAGVQFPHQAIRDTMWFNQPSKAGDQSGVMKAGTIVIFPKIPDPVLQPGKVVVLWGNRAVYVDPIDFRRIA